MPFHCGEPMEAMEAMGETSSPFLRLSNEIIEMIFTSSTLKHDDVAALARVCARFAQISRSRELWRRKALERYGKETQQHFAPLTTPPSRSDGRIGASTRTIDRAIGEKFIAIDFAGNDGSIRR